MQTETQTETAEHEVFGPVIASYTRAQAIEDGLLVDVSQADGCKGHFKFPVALTRAAWAAAIEAGGEWRAEDLPNTPQANDAAEAAGTGAIERLHLPGGQSIAGRLHDVCWMLKAAILVHPGPIDHMRFRLLVDRSGNGRTETLELAAVCGPGDTCEPVITIMLPNED